jgi:hypothetical protein
LKIAGQILGGRSARGSDAEARDHRFYALVVRMVCEEKDAATRDGGG